MDANVHNASATTRFMPPTAANRSGDIGTGVHPGSMNRPLKEEMCKIEEGFLSSDEDTRLIAVRRLRQILSEERDFLKQEDLPKSMVPKLLEWLKNKDNPTLQVDALRALTSIAAGPTEQSSVLLQNDAVDTLVSLLESSDDEILEQSVWVLGNLAGEGTSARDAVLNSGALKALVECIHAKSKLSLLRIGAWTLSNLCDGQPRPVFEICSILPTLANLLKMSDTEVLSHVCWTLSHLCDGPCAHIQQVVSADVCWRLVELLMHRSWRVTKPALRAIGNIVCAEDEQDYTQHIISCGAVPCLRQLIAHSNREIQKEACWTLSNIAAGTIEQIQYVLDSGSIPHLVSLASSEDTDTEVKSEACWVVLNATSCGSDAQIEYLVKQGCVAVLGELLAQTSMVMMALEGLERILQWVEADPDNRAPFLVGDGQMSSPMGSGTYASLMATSKIEQLENHKSAAIAKRASKIWRQHFVTCAICGRAFSKHSPDTRFCDECKCHVCNQCNCSRYHLSYQENWWKQVTEMETSVKEAKQASKRNRRAKKKLKIKEKKAALQSEPLDVNGELAERFDNQVLDSSPDELELSSEQHEALDKDKDGKIPEASSNGGKPSIKKEVERKETAVGSRPAEASKRSEKPSSLISNPPAPPHDAKGSSKATSTNRQPQDQSGKKSSATSVDDQTAGLPTQFHKSNDDDIVGQNDLKSTMRRARKNNRHNSGEKLPQETAKAKAAADGGGKVTVVDTKKAGNSKKIEKTAADVKKVVDLKAAMERESISEVKKGSDAKRGAEMKKGDTKKFATAEVGKGMESKNESISTVEQAHALKPRDDTLKDDEKGSAPVEVAAPVQKKTGGKGENDNENEHLVSYLMETGSILALAQYLDEED